MTRKELKSGIVFAWENPEYICEVSYKKHDPHWSNPFHLWFNGELHTFKTFNGVYNKANYFINKYCMMPIDENKNV